MIEGVINASSAVLVTGAQAVPPSQPTADQTARFEQQLLQPEAGADWARYDEPLMPPRTIDSEMRPLADYASQISEKMQDQMNIPELDIDAELWPELYSLQQMTQQTQALNMTSLQIQLFAKGVQLINDSVQALYQRV